MLNSYSDISCPGRDLPCGNSSLTPQCVSSHKHCDGNIDCVNGYDERDCNHESCSSGQFLCGNGDCIKEAWVCDGDKDCEDRSDESNCKLILLNIMSLDTIIIYIYIYNNEILR